MNTFTIFSPAYGQIGSFPTVEDAVTALHFLPYSVRRNAAIIIERGAA